MYEFVEAFRQPSGSPIRELFKYLSLPGMISFAGGYPAGELFDRDGLASAAERAYRHPNQCLQYASTDGLPILKDEIIALTTRRGAHCSSAELMLTTGSQQGLDLLLRVMVAPGDVVLVEQPAYPATLQALRLQGATIVTMPVDAGGLDVDAVARMLIDGSLPKAPKLLYTVPTFSNPTGLTLTRERRLALLQLAVEHRFLLIEDDPYGDLRFAGEPVPSLLALADEVPGAREWLVYFGSLSKIAAPGLRVGWTIGPEAIVRRCTIAKQTVDLCSAPWTQAIAAEYLRDGALERHLPRLRAAYGEKCAAFCEQLTAVFGERLAFHRPEGGLFVWARLTSPHGIDAQTWLQEAIEERVLFVPGHAFYADHADPAGLRLSFAAPALPDIHEGVARLGRALARFDSHTA